MKLYRNRSRRTAAIKSLLIKGIEQRWEKVDADLIEPLVTLVAETVPGKEITPDAVARVLIEEVKSACETMDNLQSGQDAFNGRHAVMETDVEIRENILAYAAELGGTGSEERTPQQIKGDRKALQRYFGHDAMVARFQSRLGDLQRRLTFLLERLGVTAKESIEQAVDPVAEWRDLNIEALTSTILQYPGDARIATAAFRCVAGAIRGLPCEFRQSVLAPGTVQTIHRLALDRERGVWIQCEAISLLYQISSETFDAVARARLVDPPQNNEDIFVRRRLVPLVVKNNTWVRHICSDPGPFVRQGLAQELQNVNPDELSFVINALALQDPEPSVRAAALLAIPLLVPNLDHALRELLAEIVSKALREEKDDYVSRIAIRVCVDGHAELAATDRKSWRKIVLPPLGEMHRSSEKIRVRRWAAQGREKIWCDSAPHLGEIRDRAKEAIRSIAPGKSVFLKDRVAAALDDITLGRVMSIVAQEDFGLDIKRSRRGIRIQRGHRFGFRFWRFLHELNDPSPDKREAFSHTIGRIFTGNLRAPSALMSEMSQTKVPGEPLTLSAESGWRPFLPLVDEVISSLDENSRRRPLRVVTSEGVTELSPPGWPTRRMKAHHTLNRRFEEFARLRNSESPADYIKALRGLGFGCDFSPPEGEETEPEVARTFSHNSLPFFAFTPIWNHSQFDFTRIKDYFYSAYENSVGQLLIFLAGAFTFFLTRHIYLNQKFYRLRKKIPLVIGGWGTRGKSGTERIKAGMLNALGHRIVSKTTGCEAMFLYSPAFGKLNELFLFRPYDKATIWEQVNLVGLASKLRSHVFLWECMALTPAYIEIIQRQWMKDDLSTLVNTYPDHEDLQGPAGINIPEVMTKFLRKGGHCLTSEQQMTPILEAAADREGCRLDKVSWIEPGLLTPDILARFPYAEHPNNIALVAEMGDRLGIPRDFALKEMADRVVPDLGVLKIYPEASIAGRRLQFVNGFSANERFATLGNWTRLGFDRQDPESEPGVWISGVINNRADRVARSQVFANIIAQDISVDCLFFIGTNLQGMVGYVRDAFDTRMKAISLFPDTGDTTQDRSPQAVLLREALRLRIPTSLEALDRRIAAIVPASDGSTIWQDAYTKSYKEFEDFSARLEQGSAREALNRDFKVLLWKWLRRKLCVIHDCHATGDQIIHRITERTPPGYLNRIMGLQNIKGTGLDFIYRWQAWDVCFKACQKLTDRKPKVAREGLIDLAAFNDYGIVCREKVEASAAESARMHGSRDPGFQTQLDLIKSNMDKSLGKIEERIKNAAGKNSEAGIFGRIGDFFFGVFESFLDGGDAIRRRKQASQIYQDLADERISPTRVVQEIQKLNKRQKGGWLKRDLAGK